MAAPRPGSAISASTGFHPSHPRAPEEDVDIMNIIRNIRTPIMHRAVEANGLVFVGGTIADDTSVSMGEQTRNILGKIAGYLKEAGTDPSRVVSASIFVTDLSGKKQMDAAWTEFFGDDLPARATVGVADLGRSALNEGVITSLKG